MFSDLSKKKIESADVVGGRCMRGNDEALYLNEKDMRTCTYVHVRICQE